MIKNNIPNLSTCKAFIFDLDGTLIDTERIYRKVWPEAMASLGYTFTDIQYLSLRSLGRPFAPLKFKEWFGQDFDYDGARKVRKRLFDAYVEEHGIDVKPGAIELLNELKKRGIMTAIATATDIDRAMEYLNMTGLSGHFDRIISATMVDEGKPSPKVYQYVASELGFTPDECVAVEDAPNGILSAYRAGCHVIMVPDQSGPEESFEDLLDGCVDSLDIIAKLLV